MIHALGVVDGPVSPAESRDHTEPSTFGLPKLASEEEYVAKVGPFHNTGNVDQTLTLGNLTNFVNCIQNGEVLFGEIEPGSTTVVVSPGSSVSAFVPIKASVVAPDTEVPYSFDLEGVWS